LYARTAVNIVYIIESVIKMYLQDMSLTVKLFDRLYLIF